MSNKLKTTAIAASMALALGAASVQAATENSFTIGVRGGLNIVTEDDPFDDANNGYGIGIYIDYNFINWLALEIGYNYIWETDVRDPTHSDARADLTTHGPEVALRFAYPIDTDGTDVYLRAGVMFTKNTFETSLREYDGRDIAPLLGIGYQFAFTPAFAFRIGWDHYFRVMDGAVSSGSYTYGKGGKIDEDLIYIGLQYSFGGTASHPVTYVDESVTEAAYAEATLTFGAETLFAFNSAELSENGYSTIASEVAKIQEAQAQNLEFEVSGYTDRLGSPNYNQALSERRATAVANALVENGIPEHEIRIVEGYGASNPVTGNQCDNIGNRNELIDCLAPDRRVEVKVSGEVNSQQPAPVTY